jgi:hypothetical protein
MATRKRGTIIRVMGNNEGNHDGRKRDGNGNKGGRQATAKPTKRVMVMATRVAGQQGLRQ